MWLPCKWLQDGPPTSLFQPDCCPGKGVHWQALGSLWDSSCQSRARPMGAGGLPQPGLQSCGVSSLLVCLCKASVGLWRGVPQHCPPHFSYLGPIQASQDRIWFTSVTCELGCGACRLCRRCCFQKGGRKEAMIGIGRKRWLENSGDSYRLLNPSLFIFGLVLNCLQSPY